MSDAFKWGRVEGTEYCTRGQSIKFCVGDTAYCVLGVSLPSEPRLMEQKQTSKCFEDVGCMAQPQKGKPCGEEYEERMGMPSAPIP